MICYKDRTWCDFHVECTKGSTCDRALTQEVRKAADEWWGKGSGGAPIALFVAPPNCYEDIYIKAQADEVEKDKQSQED